MATSSKSATAEDERISPPLSNFMTGIEQYARNSQISSSTIPLSDPILDGVVDEGYQTNLDGHGTLSNSGKNSNAITPSLLPAKTKILKI